MKILPVFAVAVAVATTPAWAQQKKWEPVPDDLPRGLLAPPKREQPVFALTTKQGMRILVSRDDGKTWEQTFLGTEGKEDGGFHGQFAVYGMAYTDGIIGVFGGWGAPGLYVGSTDGKNWAQLPKDAAVKLSSAWGAAAGKGTMLVSADPWGGAMIADGDLSNWRKEPLGKLIPKGTKTHHFISAFGDYKGGTFVVVGDARQVFYSHDLGKTWQYTTLPEGVGAEKDNQNTVAFGNGTFVVDFATQVARSTDGGATWTLHPHGLAGKAAWRGLSFVNGEFWLTARGGKGGRRSKDGITWEDLPAGTPGGQFVQAESGTIINVERGRYDVRRSTDGGKSWDVVFTAPEQSPTWSPAFVVSGRVNAARN